MCVWGGGDREEQEQGRQGRIAEYFLGPSSPGLSDKSWGRDCFVGRRRLLPGRGSRKDAVGMSVAEKVACMESSVAGLDPSALMTQSVTLSPRNWPAH